MPKILIQRLWQLQLDWDEVIQLELQMMWQQFQNNLHLFNDISIPRHVIDPNHIRLEMHGFSDASEKAYGACVYIKSFNDNMSQVHLITAKSRVASTKQISLPKFKLCAAVLLAELIDRVSSVLNLSFQKTYCWSDSTITLAWINGSPSRRHTFVANIHS